VAADFVHGLTPGDAVAVFQARQQVVPVVAEPSRDLTRLVPQAVRDVPRPAARRLARGAVANAVLNKSERAERDVIVLTTVSASAGPIPRRCNAGSSWPGRSAPASRTARLGAPRLWVVNVDRTATRSAELVAAAAARQSAGRAVGREVTFRTDLLSTARSLHAAVQPQPRSGRRASAPAGTAARFRSRQGQDSALVHASFHNQGSHLVSLVLEPDAPGALSRDTLPDDNRQDFAVEVTPTLPVLIGTATRTRPRAARRLVVARRAGPARRRDAGRQGAGGFDQGF